MDVRSLFLCNMSSSRILSPNGDGYQVAPTEARRFVYTFIVLHAITLKVP